MIKKRLGTIMAAALAVSLLFGSANSLAVYNVGENTKTFSYDGSNGTVMAMADVTGDASGTHYKYKGDMYYSTTSTLKVTVKGFYSLNGTTKPIEKTERASGKKTVTAYARIQDGATGVCTTSKPCTAIGYVNSDQVKTVKFPA